MKKLFERFKGTVITHPGYSGVVCGYSDTHLILAVESKSPNYFRTLKKDFFIDEEYKDSKYRYILEDERTIEQQLKIKPL